MADLIVVDARARVTFVGKKRTACSICDGFCERRKADEAVVCTSQLNGGFVPLPCHRRIAQKPPRLVLRHREALA